jgi:hypothetical protein
MAAKIFGVVKNKGQFCEVRYSWYIQHHHTLKRQHERFRVVEQMKRVVKDHLASGYIKRVEIRAIKEPEQEIDYIIRYYPGEGASDSIGRIQSHIRRGKTQPRISPEPSQWSRAAEPKQGNSVNDRSLTTLALSVITAHHEQLIGQLITQFGIQATKAYQLVVRSKEPVILQLEAWPFRDAKPRNRAGWMIQAIENNYDVPHAYLENKKNQQVMAARLVTGDKIRSCSLCNNKGFRFVRSAQYPTGAMRQCSHNPKTEMLYERADFGRLKISTSPNAQNSPIRGETPTNEKGPAEESANP